MELNQELQAVLDGEKGATLQKVLKTMMRYGELFGADSMVPISSEYNHLVTSFGLKALGPVYNLLDRLISEAALSQQKFSVDPRPLDPKVPSSFLQNIVFNMFMSSKQDQYETQLERLGLLNKDALILDLASAPYGTDFEAAKELGIKAMTAPGLPGKTAPKTAGKLIAESIIKAAKGGEQGG